MTRQRSVVTSRYARRRGLYSPLTLQRNRDQLAEVTAKKTVGLLPPRKINDLAKYSLGDAGFNWGDKRIMERPLLALSGKPTATD
jgi:hypothetical protein